MTKHWTEEEIQFLKFAYPNKDFKIQEICTALDRNQNSIHNKATSLKLKRFKEVLPTGLKRCARCKVVYNINCFRIKNNKPYSYCLQCEYEMNNKKYKLKSNENTHDENKSNENPILKTCPRCKRTKPINEFNKSAAKKDGVNSYCRECQRETVRESRIKKIKERGW